MTTITEPTQTELPLWIYDMKFCHVFDHDTGLILCGAELDRSRDCGTDYEGEAICPVCGQPTCPRCAQIAALEFALDE